MQQAWAFFRDDIMANWPHKDRRPAGWWWFEGPEQRRNNEPEADQLRRLKITN
jgi:hypothetical protein